jgi:1,2-diacylglycerol 3-beta-galactosyltransferase
MNAPTVDLVWFNAGGGHRAAAEALERAIAAQGWQWTVRKVNLTAVLDPTAQCRRLLGLEPEDFYNLRLSTGFTLGLAQELRLLQALIRASHSGLVQRLRRHWQATRPDMVVSLIPNFNRALHDSLALANPAAPFVTVMTDMADHPPAFWAEPGTRQHLVCGTPHAHRQAVAAGLPASRVHLVGGMLLRPAFHQPAVTDRAADRSAAGLDASTPTGLVLFGGAGSRVMRRIAHSLPDTPLILLCGRNAALVEALRAMRAPAPRVVLGHTRDVARWMRMADFFIGKPGPGSLSEAVHMGLPVVVTRNSWTMPQERWNTDWVREHGLGVVHKSFRTVGEAARELVQRLPELQANTRQMRNRAALELPHVLQRILLSAPSWQRPAQGAASCA